MLYDSLHGKVLSLAESTLVYPTHAAARGARGKASSSLVSTIADQRRNNHALQPMTKKEFVELVTSDLPGTGRIPNGPARSSAHLRPSTLNAVLALRESGVPVVDTRSQVEFAGAHLAGSVNIGLADSFGRIADRSSAREVRSRSSRNRDSNRRWPTPSASPAAWVRSTVLKAHQVPGGPHRSHRTTGTGERGGAGGSASAADAPPAAGRPIKTGVVRRRHRGKRQHPAGRTRRPDR